MQSTFTSCTIIICNVINQTNEIHQNYNTLFKFKLNNIRNSSSFMLYEWPRIELTTFFAVLFPFCLGSLCILYARMLVLTLCFCSALHLTRNKRKAGKRQQNCSMCDAREYE